jgi:hypothetical protein
MRRAAALSSPSERRLGQDPAGRPPVRSTSARRALPDGAGIGVDGDVQETPLYSSSSGLNTPPSRHPRRRGTPLPPLERRPTRHYNTPLGAFFSGREVFPCYPGVAWRASSSCRPPSSTRSPRARSWSGRPASSRNSWRTPSTRAAPASTSRWPGGGTDLIQVVDNGCGIPAEDLPLAFASHGTSKLASAEDLFRIGTLGFRGEALASAGSIAQVKLQSRPPDQVRGAESKTQFGRAGEELSGGPLSLSGSRSIGYNRYDPGRR